MSSEIKALGVYLPENILTNDQLSKEFGRWEPDKIEKKLGIETRHISSFNETAADMAFKAASKLLTDYDRNKIDMLILCTQSPDHFLPTTACILQDRLQLRKNIGAFDFNLGCSGFIYGLAMAKSFINTGIAEHILLITSETYSKHIHPKDLALKTIFGDAAVATIIDTSEKEHIFEFVLGTDGSGKENLIVHNGCFRKAWDPQAEEIITDSNDIYTNNNLYMNGPEIFSFTIDTVPEAVDQCLYKNKLSLKEIDYFIFHQANKYITGYLRKKLNLPEEKFYSDIILTGNTVSSTIPIAYQKAYETGKIKTGDKVMLCGFGVGYSWGCVIVEV
jgi:3-oxoacyl-[acyl-carrier-protein] synthase III